jgi:hypothetical protein
MTSWKILRDQKRFWATIITGAVGLIVLLDAIGVQIAILNNFAALLVNWAAVMIALALLIGLISVAATHTMRVVRQNSDWPYSLVLLLGMVLVIVAGIVGGPNALFPDTLAEEPVRWVFTTIYEPLASSLLALLAFFSLSAALRAFRYRHIEALVIVGVALVVLITQLGPVATLPFVGMTVQWFNDFVVLAGARGLLIGVALGSLVASMRVLLGFDQPYLDR